MPTATQSDITATLLEEYGETYAEQVGFTVDDSPASLYKLLVLSTLLSARIGASQAIEAAQGIFDAGWTTPDKLASTSWAERRDVLNESGYARYDESTARMLGDSMDHLMDEWGGDLRKLRDAAGGDPDELRKRLKEFKGIGDVGVDIFFREAQMAWDELRPFADERALDVAEELDLAGDAEQLATRCSEDDLPKLVAALVRVGIDDAADDIRDKASNR